MLDLRTTPWLPMRCTSGQLWGVHVLYLTSYRVSVPLGILQRYTCCTSGRGGCGLVDGGPVLAATSHHGEEPEISGKPQAFGDPGGVDAQVGGDLRPGP